MPIAKSRQIGAYITLVYHAVNVLVNVILGQIVKKYAGMNLAFAITMPIAKSRQTALARFLIFALSRQK